MKQTLTILFTLITTYVFACECSPSPQLTESQKKEFKQSDYVLVGEVLSISDDHTHFIIKLKEVFKGNLVVGQVLQFDNNYFCEPYVRQTGDWLVYGKVEDGQFTMNLCGLSRSLDNPEENRYFNGIGIPPPPPPGSAGLAEVETEESRSKRKAKMIETALVETRKELELLREKPVHNNH